MLFNILVSFFFLKCTHTSRSPPSTPTPPASPPPWSSRTPAASCPPVNRWVPLKSGFLFFVFLQEIFHVMILPAKRLSCFFFSFFLAQKMSDARFCSKIWPLILLCVCVFFFLSLFWKLLCFACSLTLIICLFAVALGCHCKQDDATRGAVLGKY